MSAKIDTDLVSQNCKMWDLRDDRVFVAFDKSIEDTMNSIDYESLFTDSSFNDDVYTDTNYIQNTYPFEWAVLNNFCIQVLEKYVQPAFVDKKISISEIKLAEGYSDGNYNWHTDKDGEYENDADIPRCEQDIICLYYFNDTDFGPLCFKYSDRPGLYKFYPRKGMIAILNEYDPGLIHKIEYYEKNQSKRYTARVSFRVE